MFLVALVACTLSDAVGIGGRNPADDGVVPEEPGNRQPRPDHPPASGSDTDAVSDCTPAAKVLLNEVSPANDEALLDVEGDTPDWIELINADGVPVDLAGWSLSDDPDEPDKWVLPAVTLDSGELLVVHASKKDRVRIVGSWDTRIDEGHEWRYLDEDPGADWFLPGYDDSDWEKGPSGFGRGDSDDATRLDANTVLVRTDLELTADELSDLVSLVLHVDYDDAFVAYLNGVEVARGGLGLLGSEPPAFDDLAVYMREATMKEGGRPAYFDLDGSLGLLHEGTNTLALGVHNASVTSSDLTLIPFLTLGFASDRGTEAPEVLELPLTELHTSFALRSSGEAVRLFDPIGCEADELDPEPLQPDESYGRRTEDGALGYFLEPTPGVPNVTEWRVGFAETPSFSPAPGYYAGGTDVTITHGALAQVHTTWEGWDPTEADDVYTGPIHTGASGQAAILRARAFEDGLWPSRIATATYLLEEPGNLPVISIVTDPANLWDDEIGIYVTGSDARPNFPWSGANFYEEWERPAHIEGWEPGLVPAFSNAGNVMIHGGNSRRHAQKNLEFDAYDDIEHEVWPGTGIDEVPRLVFRAGGGDWLGCDSEGCMEGALLRDGLMHALSVGTDVDRMGSRPSRLYLNGEFWGIYFINEKGDRAYVESHHGVEDFDLLASQGVPTQGDEMAYLEMMAWLRENSVSDPVNYAQARDWIDIEELQSYLIFQVFYANTDWPGNNIKYWRPHAPNGRWRWLLYGMDFGLGMRRTPDEDTLAMALATDGDDWPNPPWSTELFRLMFESPEFTLDFANRYADFLNTLLHPQRTTQLLQDMADEIAPDVPRQVERWGDFDDGVVSCSLEGGEWEAAVDDIEAWLLERPDHARQHVVDQFGLDGTWELTLEADPPGSGSFELHAVTVAAPFTGTYFQGVPVTITAHPAPGFTFAGWSSPFLPGIDTIVVDADEPLTVTARFE